MGKIARIIFIYFYLRRLYIAFSQLFLVVGVDILRPKAKNYTQAPTTLETYANALYIVYPTSPL
jgi:hypothetical protein